MTAMSKIVNRKNAEHYNWGDNADGWHLLKTDNLSVIEENVPPGGAEQRHFHHQSQQFFYVLSGVASIEIDGEIFEVSTGNGIHVPSKANHQLMNKGSANLKFLVISQPKSIGDRVSA